MGTILELDQRRYVYFAGGESIPPGLLSQLGPNNFWTPQVDEQLETHPRMRRILSTVFRGRPIQAPLRYNVLHWSDGTDLVALDAKVLRGQAVEADFRTALIGAPLRMRCLRCGSHVEAVYGDRGDAIVRSELENQLRAHAYRGACPVCGQTSFGGSPVLEFLAASSSSRPEAGSAPAMGRRLAAALVELDPRRILAFALAGAARALPVFRRFRTDSPPEAYEKLLEAQWEALDSDDWSRIREDCSRTQELPETRGDPGLTRAAYAVLALGSLQFPGRVVESWERASGVDLAVNQGISTLLDLANAFDFNPGFGLPDGPVVQLEVEAQRRVYELLAASPRGPLPREMLLAVSGPVIRAYEAGAVVVAARNGWILAEAED